MFFHIYTNLCNNSTNILCVFVLIISIGIYQSDPHIEEFEILAYTDGDSNEIYIYTKDDRVFRVNLPDSVKIVAISDQFPYRCTATISDNPNGYDPNRQKAHDFSRGMNAVFTFTVIYLCFQVNKIVNA